MYLGLNLYTENETIGDLEYEVDRAKLLGRGNSGIPQMIENSAPFSRNLGIVPDLDVALKRTMKIKPRRKNKHKSPNCSVRSKRKNRRKYS